MYLILDSEKSFDNAVADLDAAVKQHGFGVLHVHDIGATLRSKGIAFAEQCKVFEVCQPQQAAKVLAVDLRLNMALPCRISVYTEQGQVKIGYIQPQELLGMLSQDPVLQQVAGEVAASMQKIVTQAA